MEKSFNLRTSDGREETVTAKHISGAEYKARCPWHKPDKEASLGINDDKGIFNCLGAGCGAKGIIVGHSGQTNKTKGKIKMGVLPPINPELPKKYLESLLHSPKRLAYVKGQRGLLKETIGKYEIGWDGSRFTIPIYVKKKLVNIRRYDPQGDKAYKMISYAVPKDKSLWKDKNKPEKWTYGSTQLYGLDEMLDRPDEPVLICAGEWDKLIASQNGYLAVTTTTGEGTWKPEWNRYFKDRIVRIVYDVDPQGRAGAKKVLENLLSVAKDIRIVPLPLTGDKNDKDLTDFFVKDKRKNKKELLDSVIENAYNWKIKERMDKLKKASQEKKSVSEPAAESKKKKLKRKVDEVVLKTLTLISRNLVHLVRDDEGRVKYLLLKDGKLIIEKEFRFYDQVFSNKKKDWVTRLTIYHPFQKILYKLPESEVVNESIELDLKSLLNKIISYIKDYLEMPNETDYLVLGLWILHSYLIEHFNITPFIYFYGVFETGKTKGGEVLGELAFRCNRITCPTEATIFREAEILKTSVVIDEIKLWGKDGNIEVARLIRPRYKRGLSVPRINLNKQGEDQLEYFDVFGPTVICTDEKCPPGLESRSIIFIMAMNIKQKVEEELDLERAQRLRNKLTIFRAKYLEKGPEKQEPIARRRLNEIMMPLYRTLMLVDPERKEEFKIIVEGLQSEKGEEQRETFEADLIKEVADFYLETENILILTKDLTERINEDRPENRKFSPITVGMKMKRLGFKPGREERIDGKKGLKGWKIDEKLLKKLEAQYEIETE